ncbi:GMC family oxidoreductase N-terminal domain-containing protein [Catenulispora yoronensis]
MQDDITNADTNYDLVIVGGGIAAATVAKTVIDKAAAGRPARHPRILILEAGRATAMSADKYDTYVEAYQQALAKVPNAPYPPTVSAPQPNVLDIGRPVMGPDGTTKIPSANGYFVQMGPLPFGSDYARALGGTTLHWLGTCLRMLPNDFKMWTNYGHGVDWPLSYDDLKPYYERAEWDIIGVSANVEDQNYPGIGGDPAKFFQSSNTNKFPDGAYHFPMERIPSSYLDDYLAKKSAGLVVKLKDSAGKEYSFPILVCNTPVGRNSQPAPGYQPVGAVGNADRGQRCEGNSSCIPICPVQAKYNALKTLYELIVKYPDRDPRDGEKPRARVAIRSQCVVSKVQHTQTKGKQGTVTGVAFLRYSDDGSPAAESTVTADRYVLAANAIENATLLLASDAANNSDQVGRNLMDHPSCSPGACWRTTRVPSAAPAPPPASRPSGTAPTAPTAPRSGSRSATGAGTSRRTPPTTPSTTSSAAPGQAPRSFTAGPCAPASARSCRTSSASRGNWSRTPSPPTASRSTTATSTPWATTAR